MLEVVRERVVAGCARQKKSWLKVTPAMTLRCSNQGIGNIRKKEVETKERDHTLGSLKELLFIGERQGHIQDKKLSVGLVRSDRAEDSIISAIRGSFCLYRMFVSH